MLNDTYAVTDLNVLNVNTYHKIRASSVGRAPVFIKLQVAGSDLNGSFLLFFSVFFFFFFFFFFCSSFFFFLLLLSLIINCYYKLLQSGL